jgi:glycogen debranching enzyme
VDSIIRVKDQFYIHAESSLVDNRTHVLKQGDSFAVFDRHGDIKPVGKFSHGLYHDGTRHLSRLEVFVGGTRPILLSSAVGEDNVVLTVDLTNADLERETSSTIRRGTLHVFRSTFLWGGGCHEQFRLMNYGVEPVRVALSVKFDADFVDIFEVRGVRRRRRGKRLRSTVKPDGVQLLYKGRDGVVRRTSLEWHPCPQALSESEARYDLSLKPKEEVSLTLTVRCEQGEQKATPARYHQALEQAKHDLTRRMGEDCEIVTSHDRFNEWLDRSRRDLHMMVSETPQGAYPYAGVPWFSAPFGRDGIITAMEYLWVNPTIAKGVLGYLAATQAKETVPEQDAEPGKILHESRKGEMAALGEVPFGSYYGSVDSTPLFIMLAGAYYERTGDRGFIETLWPHLDAAMRWIDTYGDADRDGFVEYARRSSRGLVQQGWKDSYDAVFHDDGRMADAPIALCEVQGYVYAAKRSAAACAAALGKKEIGSSLLRQAEVLKQRFQESFWSDQLSSYALALDGKKRPCLVKTSNPGHCLFTEIVGERFADRLAQALVEKELFSGWGVRTVAADQTRYSPMSYHNGSVWPHDNAIIAMGLARYGHTDAAVKILRALFDASQYFDLQRLPELFCGFERRPGQGPSLYPVACSPQAWSAASVFLLLAACLGLTVRATEKRILCYRPQLPEFLREVHLRHLRVGDMSVDLVLTRTKEAVRVEALRNEGGVDIVIIK